MTRQTPAYLFLFLVSLLFGAFLLREPVLKPYRQMAVDLDQAKARLAELDDAIDGRVHSKRDIDRLTRRFGRPLALADRQAEAARFYAACEALSVGAGLSVASVQPRPDTADPSGLVTFPVNLTLEGDLAGLVALLAQLEAQPQVVAVERLNVRRRERSEHPLQMQVGLVAYGLLTPAARAELARASRTKKG